MTWKDRKRLEMTLENLNDLNDGSGTDNQIIRQTDNTNPREACARGGKSGRFREFDRNYLGKHQWIGSFGN